MLTQEQRNLIFGSLLGDGNLQTGSNGRTWRYRDIQQQKHQAYLFHKYQILSPLCNTPPAFSQTFDPRTNNTSSRYTFNTLVSPCLDLYAQMFYTYDPSQGTWKKDVPSDIYLDKHLTPEAIAYWYMDDGALKWFNKSNAMRICTESFSLGGVMRLQRVLLERYNIVTRLNVKKLQNSIGYRIAIPEISSEAFRDLIRPYLVDCMRYKVSDGYRGHL